MEAKYSGRYKSHELNNLVSQLNSQSQIEKKMKIKSIEDDRKVHKSCIQISKNNIEMRHPFNNKTRQGTFFNENPPQIPYLFIPKYKNQTFIMPDRVFQKGAAGKRFYIKMKDTSICSFKDSQSIKISQVLHKREKQLVIGGRKMQQLNRILDQNDGRQKAKRVAKYLRTRKVFNPTRTNSDLFSDVSGLLQPKDEQIIQMKKTSLAKTFGPNMWRPASRAESFSKTMTFSMSKTSQKFTVASQR